MKVPIAVMDFAGLNLVDCRSRDWMTHMGTFDQIAPLDFEWQENRWIFGEGESDVAKPRDYFSVVT